MSLFMDVSTLWLEFIIERQADNITLSDMIEAKGSSRHPLGQLAYRIISGNVWYDARIVLEDQKV
jgi:hypothetical protein